MRCLLHPRNHLRFTFHVIQKDAEEKVYFGWLCNAILGYEFSESIPMNVVTRNNGLRPELFPHESFDHPFVKDYYNGILKVEAESRISEMLANISKTENKKWWQVWKNRKRKYLVRS